MTTPDDVLDFWLGASDAEGHFDEAAAERWWRKDPAFDKSIADRFGDLLARARAGDLDHWAEDPRGRLALIVMFDQFSRNIYRDSHRMYENDDKALELTLAGLTLGHDQRLHPIERAFFYMPLMHVENREHQARCVALFEKLAESVSDDVAAVYRGNLQYAHSHRDIVERFGRFPHRNALLGRHTTEEEAAFLLEPGSSF